MILSIPGLKYQINKKSDQVKKPISAKVSKNKKAIKNTFQQLKFALSDFTDSNKAVRRAIEKNFKKNGQNVCWTSKEDLKTIIFELKNKQNPLSKRSEKVWQWIYSLKTNKFRPGTVAINLNELKGLLHGFNRKQCTELFITYFTAQLYSQKKAHFVFNNKETSLSHFGFNNSYNYMSWTTKQLAFMDKIVKRIKALGFIKIESLKIRTHKTRKVFYKLYFKALNKYSKALTVKQQNLAKKKIREDFYKKSLKPSPPYFLLGLNLSK